MWESLLLYLTPALCRLALSGGAAPPVAWWRAALSLLPVLMVLPAVWLPRCLRHEEREHVARHALYALAFTVAAGTCVRWDVVADGVREGAEWASALVAYLAVGALTLWWFCLSHVLENVRACCRLLYTHQGDVAVLPLTLVALSTFAYRVPDEAFQFSRAAIFYVPVVVAWATMFFVAYSGFATGATTTHTDPGFHFLSSASLVIAAAQLSLLEVRASPLAFQFFPVVAALLCQVTPRCGEAPRLRARRWPGVLVVGGAAGALVGLALRRRFAGLAPGLVYAAGVGGVVVATLGVRRVAGTRWVLPATLYAGLVTSALLARAVADAAASGVATSDAAASGVATSDAAASGVAASDAAASVTALDAAALVALFYLAFTLVASLAPAVYSPTPPHAAPPADRDAAPQRDAPLWASPARLLGLAGAPCGGARYDAAAIARFFDRVDPACPRAFVGVWWMQHNTFPMHLICVHRAPWRADADGGAEAYLWNRTSTTRAATLGGYLLHAVSWLTQTHVVWDGGRWVRTDNWLLPVLRLTAQTYWLYRLEDDPDQMLRLVYDARGRVVWQYRMKRIQRDARTRTRYYDEFMQAHGTERHLLAL
jgi:hypothetical protein